MLLCDIWHKYPHALSALSQITYNNFEIQSTPDNSNLQGK